MARSLTDSAFYTLDIQGMTCASCVGRIERALQKIPDIDKVTVNLATEQARIRLIANSALSADDLIQTIQKTGYEAHVHQPTQSVGTHEMAWNADGRVSVFISFLLSAPLIAPMLLMPIGEQITITDLFDIKRLRRLRIGVWCYV